MSMMIHAGGKEVARGDLDLIPLPEATESYTPVSHYHLADRLATISRDILTDYALVGEQYAIARQGNQLFGFLQFRQNQNDLGIALAFRNSYDRSMSVGFAFGGSVFVCDNLALHGDITVMKKHTKNVWNTLEDLAIATIYKGQRSFNQLVCDSDRLKAHQLEQIEGFGIMGILYGKGIISPRQLTVVRDEWIRPRHQEFTAPNAWSFYNCVTEALKTTPPSDIMENHIQAHNELIKLIS